MASPKIYLDYSPESLSSRWDYEPPPKSSRRIIISGPDGVKSSSLGGPPNYDPATMSHTERELFSQKPLYVAPLAYYATKALKPWFYKIAPSEGLLHSEVAVSIDREERANIGDIIAPWTRKDISRLDPSTWAFMIQKYDKLPQRYSRYRLALNDPNLIMLSALPSTPSFSIVTVLDLSKCSDLYDSNISQLKVLSSLCVLDTSGTNLTDQGVKNLKSTLSVSEPGPLHLRSWSLRGCSGITNRVFESLAAFPLLCLLDLRNTSVSPNKRPTILLCWDHASLLPPEGHLEYFWPHPPSGIPAQLQKLDSSAFPHTTESTRSTEQSREPTRPTEEPREPYVVHVDRQYPPPLRNTSGSLGTSSLSRLSRNAYHVNDTYGQPIDPEEGRAKRETQRDQLLQYYDELESYGYSSEYGGSDDGHYGDNWSLSGGDTEDSLGSDSGGNTPSEASLEDEDSPAHDQRGQTLSPELISSTFGDDEDPPVLESTAVTTQEQLREASSQQHDPSSPAPSISHSIVPSQDSGDEEPNGFALANAIIQEHTGPEAGVPRFYDARAQAGLAAPQKRKRHARYSLESADSYDSEQEHRRTEIEAPSSAGLKLMLLRKPPRWSTTEQLVASVSQKPVSHQQAQLQPTILASAKKRKMNASGAMAMWAQIKASNKKPGEPSGQSSTATLTVPALSGPTPKTSTTPNNPLPQAPTSKTMNDTPVRRTPLGRAPRPPGTIVRKFK